MISRHQKAEGFVWRTRRSCCILYSVQHDNSSCGGWVDSCACI